MVYEIYLNLICSSLQKQSPPFPFMNDICLYKLKPVIICITVRIKSQCEIRTCNLHSYSKSVPQKALKPLDTHDSQTIGIFRCRAQQHQPPDSLWHFILLCDNDYEAYHMLLLIKTTKGKGTEIPKNGSCCPKRTKDYTNS